MRVLRRYASVRVVALASSPTSVLRVAALPWVDWLAPVGLVRPLAEREVDQTRGTTADVGAPALWDENPARTGSSVTTAVPDTGVDAVHPDLDDLDFRNWSTLVNDRKVVDARNFNGSGCEPLLGTTDGFGHGTHVGGSRPGPARGRLAHRTTGSTRESLHSRWILTRDEVTPGIYTGAIETLVYEGAAFRQVLHVPVFAAVSLHDADPAENVRGPQGTYVSERDVFGKWDTAWPSAAGQPLIGSSADWRSVRRADGTTPGSHRSRRRRSRWPPACTSWARRSPATTSGAPARTQGSCSVVGTALPGGTGGHITAGGWIARGDSNATRAHFAFSARGSAAPTGELRYRDAVAGIDVTLVAYTALAVDGDEATLTGTVRGADGSTSSFALTARDAAEPGTGRDTLRFRLLGGSYDRSGTLGGGNVQLHR